MPQHSEYTQPHRASYFSTPSQRVCLHEGTRNSAPPTITQAQAELRDQRNRSSRPCGARTCGSGILLYCHDCAAICLVALARMVAVTLNQVDFLYSAKWVQWSPGPWP